MAWGDVRGTLSGGGTSIPGGGDMAASGSVAVNVGDLIVVEVGEAVANTVSSVTDSLHTPTTYTAQNAGSLNGGQGGRAFWFIATLNGTITSVTGSGTAGGDDFAIAATVFEGPFDLASLDRSPANASDASSPFTSTATGVLQYAKELVVALLSLARGQTDTLATSPNILAINVASSTDNAASSCSVAIGSQVTSSTASIAPAFTASGTFTGGVVSVMSFKPAVSGPALSHPPILFPLVGAASQPLAGVGVLAGRTPPPWTTWRTSKVTKLTAYAVLNADATEETASVSKLNGYAVLNADPTESTVSATKLTAYAVVNLIPILPTLPKPILFPLTDPRRGGQGLGIGPLLGYQSADWPALPVSLTEAASASDVSSPVLTWDASLTEAASASDTYSQTLTWDASLIEAASATDTYSQTVTGYASLTEAGSASDTYSQTLTWDASRAEAVSSGDTVSAAWGWDAAVTAAASADDTWSETFTGGGSSVPAKVMKITSYAVLSAELAGSASTTKITPYAVLNADPAEASVSTTKITPYAVLNADPAEASVSTTKINAYAVLVPLTPPFEPLFPPDLSLEATGGCGWRTKVVDTTVGEEYRACTWRSSLGRWVVSKRLRTPENMAGMMALFEWAQGQKRVFRFRDWTDYTVDASQGVLMPFTENRLYLGKRYTLTDMFGDTLTVDRLIFKPVPGTVTFSPLGPVVDYFTGFVTGGTLGVTSWSGEFHVPARFGSDTSDIVMRLPTGLGWDHIVIEEVRFDPLLPREP